jgi:Ca-activated chloride channel family protein
VIQVDAIRWANGDLGWLLLLPVALVPLWAAYEMWRRRVARAFGGQTLLPAMLGGVSGGRRAVAVIAVFVALELAAVAAMRPRYGLKEVSVRGLGVDVAIVLDASRSMKAADIVPDRMAAATVEIGRVLDRSRGNRVALVPFAGIAFIQSPLTVDHGVIRQYLADLHVRDLPVPGTALGRALRVAGTALGVDDETPRGSTHKAILLFTDGENHEGDPEAVAAELAKRNVRIFTIGVGTPAGRPIPILDERGAVTGTAREADGVTPILSKLNEPLLKSLAEKTGGAYHALTSGQDVATALAADLEALEKAEYMARVDRLLEDRFQYPLAGSVAMMALAFLALGGARPRRRGRAAAAGAAAMAALVVAGAGWPGTATAQALLERDHPEVADALELLEKGQSGDAAKALGELADTMPARPDLWYDVALARHAAGDLEGAVQAADQALAALDRARQSHPAWPTRARILHARGTILAEQARKASVDGKPAREVRTTWRQAVEALAQALLADPAAEDTRRNLELASLAAYPSCRSLDDRHEPNNVPADAKFLTPDPNTLEFKEELLLCPGDVDRFRLPLNPGETLFARVLAPQEEAPQSADPAAGPQGGAAPQPKAADVDVALDGGGPFAGPAKDVRRTADAQSDAYLTITGPEREDGVPYVLEARVVPPCPAGDDAHEANNTADAAKVVEDGDVAGRVCPADDDWFRYVEKQGEQRQVVLEVPTGDGPLELEVFQADGTPMDVTRQDGEGGQSLSVALPKAEQEAPFLIRVFGGGNQGFYKLSIRKGEGGGQDERQQQPDPQQQEPQAQPQPQDAGSRTMRELLDAIDRNEENLEAQKAARESPFRDRVPDKDW